jgi:hypothetical protein
MNITPGSSCRFVACAIVQTLQSSAFDLSSSTFFAPLHFFGKTPDGL